MPINDVQTTNRQHAVPQNIMDVEFKIVGDLTMRQFFYLMIFGAFAYGAFVGLNNLLKWPTVIIAVLSGIAFAFLPIEERGLDVWIINFFRSIYTPNQRVWRKEPEIPKAFSFEALNMVKTELITLTPTTSRRKLEEFLNTQNEQAFKDPLDIPESSYREMVRDAFANVAVEAPVETMAPIEAPVLVPQVQDLKPEDIKDTNKEAKEPKAEEHSKAQENEATKGEDKHTEVPKEIQAPEVKQEVAKEQKPKLQIPKKKKSNTYLEPMTPDRHTGRRFTNLLPKEGEIVLPIRGERILQTTEEQKIDEDIEEKAAQLKQLLHQLSEDENYKHAVTQTKEVHDKLHEATKNIQTNKPQELQQPVNQQPAKPQEIPLQQVAMQPKQTGNYIQPEPTQIEQGVEAQIANMNPITNRPNIISGQVKDMAGNPLEGLVLIIKNEKDEPVRALKTNQLGQFSISTPVTNGHYKIETDKSKKTDLSFDIINIEAVGSVIPPAEIVGK